MDRGYQAAPRLQVGSNRADTRQFGFYSHGEISPCATGPCDLHNQTMTLTTIREFAAAA